LLKQPSEWAEITHPFHPLRGKRFLVLRTRKWGGQEVLTLKDPARGTFCVPLAWTDLSAPAEQEGPKEPLLDFHKLLELAALLSSLEKKRIDAP